MNKIYKVIWSKTKHCYVVTSELAKCQGKYGGARVLRRTAAVLGVTAALLGGWSYGGAVAHAAEYVTVNSNESVTISDDQSGKTYLLNGSAITFTVADQGKADAIKGSSDGAIDGNTVSITGGSVAQGAYGGFSASGTVTNNVLNIEGGSVYADVEWTDIPDLFDKLNLAGGYSEDGEVRGNAVTVNGGELTGEFTAVAGGDSYNSDAVDNTITVNGGTNVQFVYGGVTVNGKAGGNKAYINTGAVVTCVFGGSSDNGSATDNAVIISGGTVEDESGNGAVVGGFGEKGTASSNKVTVSGGNVFVDIYGGYSVSDAVYNNEVTVSQAGSEAETNVSAAVIGGFSENGTVSSNKVTVSGGSVEDIAGGGSFDGDAVSNTVSISGGSVEDAIGGTSESGVADSNTVIVTGGILEKGAYGGYSEAGAVTNNVLSIEGGSVFADVEWTDVTDEFDGFNLAGGRSFNGEARENTVTINGGGLTGEFTAVSGGDSYNNNAIKNKIFVNGGTNVQCVYGGTSINGNVENNEAYINAGAHVAEYVAGGESDNGDATGNTATVSGGTVGYENDHAYVAGGYSENGAATSNTVIFSGGTIHGSVVGGWGVTSASGNTVTVKDGAVFGKDSYIFGGVPVNEIEVEAGMPEGIAADNTVNILKAITVAGLYGGYGTSPESAGNTLNLAAKNVVAGQVDGFQNMNFYLPADIANNDTMLTLNGGSPTDVKGVTFGAAAQQGVDLVVGDTVNLIINESGLITDEALTTTTSMTVPEDIATDTNYELGISKLDGNTLIATVNSKTPMNNEDRHKSPAETREAVVSLVNAGADLLAGTGMRNAADAAASEQAGKDGVAAPGTGGYAPFAAVGGSSLRAESGSHVTTKGIGLALGFARELKNRSGKLLIGPVLEYGHGRYDSYQDNGTKADGKAHYWGIGVIAKQTNKNGLYYEGSLRVGRTGSDYNRNDPGLGSMNYDSDATYFGAHLGIGKLMDIGHKNTLDYYGKYFYSHTGGDSVTMHTGTFGDIRADFEATDSHRLRVGARITHELNEKNNVYCGLAYQYEFNGDARVTYSSGGRAPSPSVKGSSGMLELGWQVKPGRSPMVIDLNVTGWTGKQRGITANLQANWTF